MTNSSVRELVDQDGNTDDPNTCPKCGSKRLHWIQSNNPEFDYELACEHCPWWIGVAWKPKAAA
jgi:hypothetical protein